MSLIYKICPEALWHAAEAKGVFEGSAVDLADGYIHFSTGKQVHETAAKHFRGQRDLLLIAVSPATLGDGLRYEPSRGGALFPHLYATLDPRQVRSVVKLETGDDGVPLIPEDIA